MSHGAVATLSRSALGAFAYASTVALTARMAEMLIPYWPLMRLMIPAASCSSPLEATVTTSPATVAW